MASIANTALSFVIDPITRDLIETSDGWFQESTDSRTMVLWQLEATFATWWGDSTSGSRCKQLISGENPGDIVAVKDEALRALQLLVNDGIISQLSASTDVDETGRSVVVLNYYDASSGSFVDLAYVPFGG